MIGRIGNVSDILNGDSIALQESRRHTVAIEIEGIPERVNADCVFLSPCRRPDEHTWLNQQQTSSATPEAVGKPTIYRRMTSSMQREPALEEPDAEMNEQGNTAASNELPVVVDKVVK